MKHKAFLVLIVLGFTFGSMALANYVEPQSTTNPNCTYSQAPDCNTPSVIKTGPGANTSGSRSFSVIKSKIGIGDGINLPDSSLVSNVSYIGTGCAGSACPVKTGSTGDKGGFMEKLVVMGTTKVIGGSKPKDLLVKINATNSSSFDQWITNVKYVYPENTTPKNAMDLEAVVAGRYISKIMITNSPDTSNNDINEPLSLKLQATAGSNPFLPTTNIGSGNTCNLYPKDLGTVPGDGGGCPAGSYISKYTPPSFSGTPSTGSNLNSTVVAVCKQFNPSASPTNTDCGSAVVKPVLKYADDGRCDYNVPSSVVGPQNASIYKNGVYYASGASIINESCTDSFTYQVPSPAASGAMVRVKSYNCNIYFPTNSVSNPKVKWYDNNTYDSSMDNKTELATFGATTYSPKWCASFNTSKIKLVVTDDYGQYIELTR